MFTVVGYDKDNDVYIPYAKYSVEWFAGLKASELVNEIRRGELRREDNGEPIDWIEIFENFNEPNERKIGVFA